MKKKKKPSEALFHPLPGIRPWIRRFCERVSTPRGARGGSEAEAEVSERHLLSRSVPRSSTPVSQEQ